MASGHEPTLYAEVMNKVNGSVDDNGDRPGTRTYRFLLQGWRNRSVTRYRVEVGLSVHEYVFSFYKATGLFSSDPKTAAVSR